MQAIYWNKPRSALSPLLVLSKPHLAKSGSTRKQVPECLSRLSLKILGMESLPDWHPHLCMNYANSIHQSRSKQHCQTVDFTEATDTGIAFSSVLMQTNSPITDISAIHARFRSHHVKDVGKPAYIVQTIRWIKCAAGAKSRHWKRSNHTYT